MVLHVVHKSGCFNVQINLKWTWKYDWLVCNGRQYRKVNIRWLHKYHYLFVFYFQMRSMENQVETSLSALYQTRKDMLNLIYHILYKDS